MPNDLEGWAQRVAAADGSTAAWATAAGAVLILILRTRKAIEAAASAWAWLTMAFGGAKRVHERLEVVEELLTTIRNEVSFNGGGSMKDMQRATYHLAARANLTAQAILAHFSEPVMQFDAHGGCLFANHAACELFGIDYSQMRGSGWLKSVDERERQRVHRVWMESVSDDTPYSDTFTVVNQRTGARTTKTLVVTAFRLEDDAILFHGVLRSPLDRASQT